MIPPLPPVEQESAHGQQDQDDTGYQKVEDKARDLGSRDSCRLTVMACVSQRNRVKPCWVPGTARTCSCSFQLCRAPPIPRAPLSLQHPEGQLRASGKVWLGRKGGGTAKGWWEEGRSLFGIRAVSERCGSIFCLLGCMLQGLNRRSHRSHTGQVCPGDIFQLLALRGSREWRCCRVKVNASRLCLDTAYPWTGGELYSLRLGSLTRLSRGLFQCPVSIHY